MNYTQLIFPFVLSINFNKLLYLWLKQDIDVYLKNKNKKKTTWPNSDYEKVLFFDVYSFLLCLLTQPSFLSLSLGWKKDDWHLRKARTNMNEEV